MSNLQPAPPRLPWGWLAMGLLALAYLLLPLIGLVGKVPWLQLTGVALAPSSVELMKVSLLSALLSTALATVLGLGLSLWLHHLQRLAALARLIIYLPLALPPVTAGLALNAVFGRTGILAPLLSILGWQIPFTFCAVVLAHLFVTLPFVVATTEQALRHMNPDIALSARSLGMTPREILHHITLPTLAPALLAGAALAFARSLGEFGATLTFAGSLPGVTRTMPVGIYLEREISEDSAYALSAILVALAIACLCLAALPHLLRKTPNREFTPTKDIDIAELAALSRPTSKPPHLHVQRGLRTMDLLPGTTTAIIGENGSGKTTLAKQLAGLLTPANKGPSFSRNNVNPPPALLTQDPALPQFPTAGKAVNMVSKDPARTRRLFDAAGLSALIDTKVSHLSAGQAAQVALLRALALRPNALILDEPFAALDVTRAQQWRAFFHVHATDRTMAIISHDLSDVVELCTHTAALDSGEFAATGTTHNVLSRPANHFIANLSGVNLIRGEIVQLSPAPVGNALTLANHGHQGHILLPAGTLPDFLLPGAHVCLAFPPDAATVLPGEPREATASTGSTGSTELLAATLLGSYSRSNSHHVVRAEFAGCPITVSGGSVPVDSCGSSGVGTHRSSKECRQVTVAVEDNQMAIYPSEARMQQETERTTKTQR
ncbi:ATP-binding cassette domain-containing protein [Corynebacterium phocae]|uniref:ATP-binding cassette domain-containing protein n=1 Tax=Corynebacterium phocae TaxID=161895 RepID=UPI0014713116|nr:ATP-binding cassette domain-containing protein [Corynebacterium phocae]